MDNRNSIINSAQALPCSSPCTASLSCSFLLLPLRPPYFASVLLAHGATLWQFLLHRCGCDCCLVVPPMSFSIVGHQLCHRRPKAPPEFPFLCFVCFSSLSFIAVSRHRHCPAFSMPPVHCPTTINPLAGATITQSSL